MISSAKLGYLWMRVGGARRATSLVLSTLCLSGSLACAQEADGSSAEKTYLDVALATGEGTGVGFADPSEKVEGPRTISGTKSFVSPLTYFKDLPPWDAGYQPPRLFDGRPDMQGVWSSSSLTTMERGENGDAIGTALVIPHEKIDELTRGSAYSKAAAASQKRSDPNAGVFTDRNVEAGYNSFWIDPGSEYAKVDTEWRSSWITLPSNGQVPLSAEGKARLGQRVENVKRVDNTGPEIRPIGDRCLASFASQAGPPLNNTMYNNNYQIVQTPTSVLINVEMNHDVRIINIEDKSGLKARPDVIKQWFGESVGRWEDDTLVVVTRNFSSLQLEAGAYPVSDKGQVTERFTRVSDDVIDYRFEVDDRVYYTQVWTGQMPLRRSNERIFEYACHEGNYALPGILRSDARGEDTAIMSDGE